MIIGTTFLVIAIAIILIWIIFEFNGVKHKILAILILGLILFFYFSSVSVFKKYDLDYKSLSGLKESVLVYFSWMGSVFGNLKEITSNAINMNWSPDKVKQNSTES